MGSPLGTANYISGCCNPKKVGKHQGRNEVWWRPGKEVSLASPCSNLRSSVSKCTVLKNVLVTVLGFFGATRSDSAPGELLPLAPLRYAPGKHCFKLPIKTL